MPSKLLPLNNFVFFIEDKEEEHETASGFLVGQEGLPVTGSGIVHALPKKATEPELEHILESLKVGDRILFSKFSAEDVQLFEDGKRIERLKSVHLSSIHARI